MAAIDAYLKELPARQAELKLTLAEVESLPNMKQKDRESMLKKWMSVADVKPAAHKATPGILKLMGIGVRHV
jgi:hypothetical protein